MQVEPQQNSAISRLRSWRRWLAAAFGIGLVVAWGSDRQPADATKFVMWRVAHPLKQPEETVLRIASYNIHSGKGGDGVRSLIRIAGDLEDVDFAGLYEVRARPGSRLPDQAAELGARLKLRSAFLATEHRWWHDHFGNAILTARSVTGVQRIPLIGTRGKAFRQAVLTDVPLQEESVHILMVHVDREQDREQQLAAVIRLFLSLQAPAVLMGDLNSGPQDPDIAELLARPGVESVVHAKLGDAAPKDNIDWIITRGLECVTATYAETGASDHPVVKAELRLRH